MLNGNFTTADRQLNELKLIQRFDTYKCGLNRDSGFLSKYAFFTGHNIFAHFFENLYWRSLLPPLNNDVTLSNLRHLCFDVCVVFSALCVYLMCLSNKHLLTATEEGHRRGWKFWFSCLIVFSSTLDFHLFHINYFLL